MTPAWVDVVLGVAGLLTIAGLLYRGVVVPVKAASSSVEKAATGWAKHGEVLTQIATDFNGTGGGTLKRKLNEVGMHLSAQDETQQEIKAEQARQATVLAAIEERLK